MSVITDVIDAIVIRLTSSNLFGRNVYVSVAPLSTVDWFPACAIVLPVRVLFRRSSATDNGALGAISAAPIFQLTDVFADIIIRTTSVTSPPGQGIDELRYSSGSGHFYYVVETMRLLNGMRIKKSGEIINPAGIAIQSVEPISRFVVEQYQERKQQTTMHGMEVESVIHTYTVVELDSYSRSEPLGHIIEI